MEKYDIKDKQIKPHNILFSITSNIDYEMERLILLENMPDTKYEEYILCEGSHCSCYDFDETYWDCIKLDSKELFEILDKNCYGLRKDLKKFLIEYYGKGEKGEFLI